MEVPNYRCCLVLHSSAIWAPNLINIPPGYGAPPSPEENHEAPLSYLTFASPATGGRVAARATGLPCKPDDWPGCQVQAAVRICPTPAST